MNLSTFIHSEKDRHGMRSMKIEPVGSVQPSYSTEKERIDGVEAVLEKGLPEGTKLYTEAQLRQLGEACAALVDELDCGRFGDAVAIRELIKEMMG